MEKLDMQFVVKVVCTIIQVAIYPGKKQCIWNTRWLLVHANMIFSSTDWLIYEVREHTEYTMAYTLIIQSFYNKIDLTPTNIIPTKQLTWYLLTFLQNNTTEQIAKYSPNTWNAKELHLFTTNVVSSH